MTEISVDLAVRDDLPVRVTESQLDGGSLIAAALQLAELVSTGDQHAIDEARLRAEAVELYEKRRQHTERERYFSILRLLAEAALGSLSFADPTVVPRPGVRRNYQILASAFERGKLLDVCAHADDLRTYPLAIQLGDEGFWWVPRASLGLGKGDSVRWSEARQLAAVRGVSLADLPCDERHAKSIRQGRARQAQAQSMRMERTYAARRRLERIERRGLIAAAAKETGPSTGKAYASLRQTLQAMHEAQFEIPREQRGLLDDIFSLLHEAEDALGRLLRIN